MPKVLTILHEPDPFLRRRMQELSSDKVSLPEIQQLIDDMVVTMRHAHGIGLAATQVGYDARVIVIETKDGPLVCINPEITKHSNQKEAGEEGCLSVPGTYGFVKRFAAVTVHSLDRDGKKQTHQARGLLARVFQHEIDHLNGIVFIDKAESFSTAELPERAIAI